MKPIQSVVWSCGLAVVAAMLAPAATAAEPADTTELKKLSLQELMNVQISTVSRVDERVDEAPGNVYVFTREVIQQRGYRSLGELLQVVPGFTVFHRDLDFVAGVRGLNANDNEKITLLINGQNLNNIHEPDFLNGPINLDNVERVEVVVGPSSLFQPANTLAATVNIITKTVNGGEVLAATGNALPYSATFMIGKRWEADKSISFAVTTEKKRGFDAWAADFRAPVAGRKLTGELDWPSYFAVLKGQYGELTAQAVAYRATWPELNIDSGSRLNNGQFVDQFYSIFVQDEHPFSADLASVVRADATWKQTTRHNLNGAPVDAVEQFLKQLVYTGELGLRYTGFTHQLIQAGLQASYEDNWNDLYTWSSGGTSTRTPLFRRNPYSVGFYADDTLRLTDWLKLIGGVRVDHNARLTGERWFPGARAAIIIEPVTNWVSKLIYNRAVRVPSSLEAMNIAWGAGVPGSPSWAAISTPARQPEILSTFEWQNIVYVGQARLAASVYHQELENFITWFGPHSNGGNFRGFGAELNAQVPLDNRVTLWANGAWNDSHLYLFNPALFGPGQGTNEAHHSYVNHDNRIIGSAKWTVNVGVDFQLLEHLKFSPELRYVTEQAAVNHTTQKYIYIRNNYYLDATLTWTGWRNVHHTEMDVRLSGRNLLDNRDPVGAQMTGDTYRPRGIEVVLAVDLRY